MKYYLLLLAIQFIGMTQRAWAIDGEVFTVEATDGIVLRYTVINSVEKTCMLGITETKEDEHYKTAFADGSAGKGTGMAWISTGLVIPSEANGGSARFRVGNVSHKILLNSF